MTTAEKAIDIQVAVTMCVMDELGRTSDDRSYAKFDHESVVKGCANITKDIIENMHDNPWGDYLEPLGTGSSSSCYKLAHNDIVYTLTSSRDKWKSFCLDIERGEDTDFLPDMEIVHDAHSYKVLKMPLYRIAETKEEIETVNLIKWLVDAVFSFDPEEESLRQIFAEAMEDHEDVSSDDDKRILNTSFETLIKFVDWNSWGYGDTLFDSADIDNGNILFDKNGDPVLIDPIFIEEHM